MSTYNLFESRLVSTDLQIEDAVIKAVNMKRPRPNAAKRDHNKEAPPGKRANIANRSPI